MMDYTDSLPDECLALIFNFLKTIKDRKNSSLVSHRWLRIEAQTHTRLTLDARSELRPFIPSIFTRFNSLTHLVLSYNIYSASVDDDSINDNDMILITSKCPNLKRLELSCVNVSDVGLISVAENCRALKKLSVWNGKVIDIGDEGLIAVGKHCMNLQELFLEDVYVSDVGLITVAQNCRVLKKLWVRNCNGSVEIGDEGLIAVGKHCVNLQELSLIGVDVSYVSLQVIATNCQNLVWLYLSKSDTITDVEMQCIADKCTALKYLCIQKCHEVSDKGIEAFALGCPNLADIRVIKCYKVTHKVKDLLLARGGQVDFF